MPLDQIGLSFLPSPGVNAPRSDTGAPGGGRLEDVLRVLSFRMPKNLGPNAISPEELLNSPGGTALPSGGGSGSGDPLADIISRHAINNIPKAPGMPTPTVPQAPPAVPTPTVPVPSEPPTAPSSDGGMGDRALLPRVPGMPVRGPMSVDPAQWNGPGPAPWEMPAAPKPAAPAPYAPPPDIGNGASNPYGSFAPGLPSNPTPKPRIVPIDNQPPGGTAGPDPFFGGGGGVHGPGFAGGEGTRRNSMLADLTAMILRQLGGRG